MSYIITIFVRLYFLKRTYRSLVVTRKLPSHLLSLKYVGLVKNTSFLLHNSVYTDWHLFCAFLFVWLLNNIVHNAKNSDAFFSFLFIDNYIILLLIGQYIKHVGPVGVVRLLSDKHFFSFPSILTGQCKLVHLVKALTLSA